MYPLEVMGHVIKDEKEVAPTHLFLRPLQVHIAIVASAGKEFLDAHLCRDLFEWLLGVRDRQRNQNRPRPGRNLVDVEPEPVRKEHYLWRNRRYGIVVVLAEEAEIELGESIHLGYAAQG